MERYNFTRRGALSWSVSIKDNDAPIRSALKKLITDFVPNTLCYKTQYHPMLQTEYPSIYTQTTRATTRTLCNDLDIGAGALELTNNEKSEFWKLARKIDLSHLPDPILLQQMGRIVHVQPSVNTQHQLWLHLYLAPGGYDSAKQLLADNDDITIATNIRNLNKQLYSISEIKTIINTLMGELDRPSDSMIGYGIKMDEDVQDIYNSMEDKVIILPAQKRPTLAMLRVGKNLKNFHGSKSKSARTVKTILNIESQNPNVEFIYNPGLLDFINMSKAEPYQDEDGLLLPYQQQAVGLHLATKIGYVQSADTGLGKTVIALSAMRERAKHIENYRGLVVCEANTRSQWADEEAPKWFPEATVLKLSKFADVDKLSKALMTEGPVLIVMGYNLALSVYHEAEVSKKFLESVHNVHPKSKRYKELYSAFANREKDVGVLLNMIHWHDICADESVVIRTGGSKQASGLWQLRSNSDVAVALTATPINTSVDDLGRLIAWVRNNKGMFSGHPISQMFDTTTEKGGEQFYKNFTPLVFRIDKSEAKALLKKDGSNVNIPEVGEPTIALLTPSAEEVALANAAEKELHRCYEELEEALENVDASKVNADDLKQAKIKLREARGAWLGGTQLARMATSDPEALLGSESVAASLLKGQGLVQAAMKNEPTKRAYFIKKAKEIVAKGEQIVVFTSFTSVASLLTKALNDNGIIAKSYTGKNINTRDKARKEFQDGQIDVLVCSKTAERGLNLQKASVLCHYDLPWTLDSMIQRTGRVRRIGSTNAKVETIFIILAGTIEEKIAGNIANIGDQASNILDRSRGIKSSETTITSAIKGLDLAKRKVDKSVPQGYELGKVLFG